MALSTREKKERAITARKGTGENDSSRNERRGRVFFSLCPAGRDGRNGNDVKKSSSERKKS